MNAVKIEKATSALSNRLFDLGEFPFEFIQALGLNETVLQRAIEGAA